MKNLLRRCAGLVLLTGWCGAFLLAGCDGTANDPARELDGNFSGTYTTSAAVLTSSTAADGSAVTTVSSSPALIVTTNSGVPITSLKITQVRDALQAVDNAGDVFTGTFSISYALGGMIQLDGHASDGTPVHIAGYLQAAGSAAWINASWIEPNLKSALYATATVEAFSPTNSAVWIR